MNKIKIEMGEPRKLDGKTGTFPAVDTFSDGNVIVRAAVGEDKLPTKEEHVQMFEIEPNQTNTPEDFINKQKLYVNYSSYVAGSRKVISTDGGKTWRIYGMPNIHMVELTDGNIYGIETLTKEKSGKLCGKAWRSTDKGKTWIGPDYVPVIGPSMTDCSFLSSVKEIQGGTLLATGTISVQGEERIRNVIFRSINRGKSWEYYSTVVVDPLWENNPRGFGEPVMEVLHNGDLLCLWRTGSYYPIMQARSSDGGATWSEPELTGVDGVDPDFVRLSNGVLACSYGRPGVWVMFSVDGEGKRWTNRICIWNGNDATGHLPKRGTERSDCYTGIREIAPNKILLVYSAPKEQSKTNIKNAWDPKERKEFTIWGIDIEVGVE